MTKESDAALSEAIAKLQEEGLDKPTSKPAPVSEDVAGVQEVVATEVKPQPEVVDTKALEEKIRRDEQSKRDRLINQERLKWQEQEAERQKQALNDAEEKRARETLDSEDYGVYAKQRDENAAKAKVEQAQRAQAEQAAAVNEIQRRYNAGLTRMPTAELRAQLEALATDTTKVNSIESFEDAVTEMLAEHKSAIKDAARAKVAQEAATRNTTAEVAELAAPVTGTGLPQSSTRRQLTTDENLSAGIVEALKAKRK